MSPNSLGSGPSTAAPWSKIKAQQNKSSASFANRDFPTAAEAAAVKKAQEEREKAEAAEAAAKHEQYLKSLDRFRGASLGSGKHWDELDDDEGGFLDEVVEFGDGTQYKIPAQPHQKESEMDSAGMTTQNEPVSKEERFRDVGHDRSWPLKAPSSQTGPQSPAPAVTPAPVAQSQPASAPARKPAMVKETLDIMSGAPSISLDDPMQSRTYEGRGARVTGGTGGGYGGIRRDAGPAPSRADMGRATASSQAAARAWGPLAVRQASLNPGAAPPQPPAPASPSTTPADNVPSSASAPEPAPSYVSPPTIAKRAAPATSASRQVPSSAAPAARALPPHLALQQQQQQQEPKLQPQPVSQPQSAAVQSHPPAEVRSPSQQVVSPPLRSGLPTVPWARRTEHAIQPTSPPQPSEAQTSSQPPAATSPPPAQSNREEMQSAVERARRRRQEEEDLRAAEKERARQKALAIEEKMRQIDADKRREEEEKRKAIEDKRAAHEAHMQRKEEQRKALEEQRKQNHRMDGAEARRQHELSSAKVSPGQSRPQQLHIAPNARSASGPQQPLSPGEEAVNWRRQTPLPVTKERKGSQAQRRPSQSPPAPARAQPVSPRLLRRPSEADAEIMPSLDGIVSRMQSNEATPHVLVNSERRQQQGQKRADHAAKPTVGGEKPSNIAPAQRVAPEPTLTREPLPVEAPPVWNKYKVRVNRPFAPNGRPASKTQHAKLDSASVQPTYALTWEPPIPTLSARTLNRDDDFFRRKYQKGKVISVVSLPQKRLPPAPAASLQVLSQADRSDQKVTVKLPGQVKAEPSEGDARFESLPNVGPAVPMIPTEPASMRARRTGPLAPGLTPSIGLAVTTPPIVMTDEKGNVDTSTRPEVGFNGKGGAGHRKHSGSGIAFSQRAAVGSGRAGTSGAASPVFMVSSELDTSQHVPSADATHSGSSALSGIPVSPASANLASSSASIAPAASSLPASTMTTPLLPSTSLSSSTWGQGPLTFLDTANNGQQQPGRQPPPQHQQQQQQHALKDMWSRPTATPHDRTGARGPNAPAMLMTASSSGSAGANSMREIGETGNDSSTFLPSTLLNDDGGDVAIPGGISDDTVVGLNGSSSVARVDGFGGHGSGTHSAPPASPDMPRESAGSKHYMTQHQQPSSAYYPSDAMYVSHGQQVQRSQYAGQYRDSNAYMPGARDAYGYNQDHRHFKADSPSAGMFRSSLGPVDTSNYGRGSPDQFYYASQQQQQQQQQRYCNSGSQWTPDHNSFYGNASRMPFARGGGRSLAYGGGGGANSTGSGVPSTGGFSTTSATSSPSTAYSGSTSRGGMFSGGDSTGADYRGASRPSAPSPYSNHQQGYGGYGRHPQAHQQQYGSGAASAGPKLNATANAFQQRSSPHYAHREQPTRYSANGRDQRGAKQARQDAGAAVDGTAAGGFREVDHATSSVTGMGEPEKDRQSSQDAAAALWS